jgi:bifunctional non-homologous end joining protein LigD
MSLHDYWAKRNFAVTPEPHGHATVQTQWPPRFVLGQHRASRLHFDFRLEIDGVLASWAVPLGPSTKPADKRFAARTEDHPVEYLPFEGVIPKGEYGAGHAIVWDTGEFVPVPEPKGSPPEIDPEKGAALLRAQLAKGELKVELLGHKMQGRWALVDIGKKSGDNSWLLIKDRDAHSTDDGGLPGDPYSVLSGRLLDEAVYPGHIWTTGDEQARALAFIDDAPAKGGVLELQHGAVKLTNLDKPYWPATGNHPPLVKRDFLRYIVQMARPLLRHLGDRPLALTRYPDGAFGQSFYQKDRFAGTPDWVRHVPIYSDHRVERGDGDIQFVLAENLATLVWLAQLGTIEVHPWISRIAPAAFGDAEFTTAFGGSRANLDGSALNYPDFLLFDIDPYVYSGQEKPGSEPELHADGYWRGVEGAFEVKQVLDSLGIPSWIKTSGKTGLHIHAPIRRQYTFTECRALVATIVDRMAVLEPDKFTVEWTVEKRRGKIFMDKNQNVRGKNMAGAFWTRPSAEATVSMPVTWRQLETVYPTDFTILTAPAWVEEHGDAWLDILAAPTDLSAILG